MTNSEVILKTYREIVSRLDHPYYVLEGLSGSSGDNQILHSSPNLRSIFGISQIDLARNSKLFFDSIHPDHIQKYIDSNQKLLEGTAQDLRTYLVKNQESGEFIPVEELATSRLNKDKNCFEIYCTVRKATAHLDAAHTDDFKKLANVVGNVSGIHDHQRKKLFESTRYFVDAMGEHFKLSGARFYGYNQNSRELIILADVQNKKYQRRLEGITGINTKKVTPQYSEDNYLYKKIEERSYQIFNDRDEIAELVKAHSENSIIKKMTKTAMRIYKIKSFGILPITCPRGKTVGVVTFASPNPYMEEEEKKMIYDFTTTNTFIFTPLLCELFDEK